MENQGIGKSKKIDPDVNSPRHARQDHGLGNDWHCTIIFWFNFAPVPLILVFVFCSSLTFCSFVALPAGSISICGFFFPI